MQFRIDDEVAALGIRGAFAVLSGIDNTRYHPDFDVYRTALKEQLSGELTDAFVETDPVLAGFRALHDKIGRSNRRFPASAEALVTLFQRKQLIPTINPAVDVYNAVSLETRLSLGAHDVARVEGDITLKLTSGTERFVPLGASSAEPITAGEYAYVDASGDVLCRLEHRQCEKSKVTAETTAAFYIIQGNPNTSRGRIEAALQLLVERTQRFCGGVCEQFWLID